MSKTLQQGFREYATIISGALAEVGVESIKKNANEISKAADEFYGRFFMELYQEISKGVTSTPSRLEQNMGGEPRWAPLSDSWSDRKVISGDGEFFYIGMTAAAKRARDQAGSPKKKGRIRNADKPFMQFMNDKAIASKKNVDKFFGPLTITYSLVGKGRKKPINIQQQQGIIQEISGISAHDSRGKYIPSLGNVTLEADISMFPLLSKVAAFNEWYVVDYLSKKDPSNRAQWRKINSMTTPRGRRPLRALITPMISWYATTGFRQLLSRLYL